MEPSLTRARFWTSKDFNDQEKRRRRESLRTVGLGWALMIAGLLLANIMDAEKGAAWQLPRMLSLALAFYGFYLGVLKWFMPSILGVTTSTISREAGRQQDWFREAKCPSCCEMVRVNIGYVEYVCGECGTTNCVRAAIRPNPWYKGPIKPTPEELVKEPLTCVRCKKTHVVIEMTAWFVCPSCGRSVELGNIGLLCRE